MTGTIDQGYGYLAMAILTRHIKQKTLPFLLSFFFIIQLVPSTLSAYTRDNSYIKDFLHATHIPFTTEALQEGTGAFGENILISFYKNTSESLYSPLVIAIPIDNNELGIEASRYLIEKINNTLLPRSIDIVFLADEKSSLPSKLNMTSHHGLLALKEGYDYPEQTIVLYVDIQKNSSSFKIQHASSGHIVPLEILKPLSLALKASSTSWNIETPWNELFRLHLANGPSDLEILNEAGFNAIALRTHKTGSPPLHPDALADILMETIEKLPQNLNVVDVRYSIVHFGPVFWLVSEFTLIVLFLLATFLTAVYILWYSMVNRKIMRARQRVFFKRLWLLPVLFVLLYGCYLASTFWINFLYGHIQPNVEDASHIHIAIKGILYLFCSITLYTLLTYLLLYRRLPVRSHFWATATVIFFGIDTLLIASIDFSLLPLILWAYCLAFASALIKNSMLSFVLAITSMLPIAGTIYAATINERAHLLESLASSSPLNALFLITLLFPFLLILKKAVPRKTRRLDFYTLGIHLPPRITFFIASILTSYFTLQALPHIEKSSLGIVNLLSSEIEEASSILEGTDLKTEVLVNTFMDRKNISVKINLDQQPNRIEFYLSSFQPIVIYDSNFPWTSNLDETSVYFYTGDYPPHFFEFNFTCPEKTNAILYIKSLFYREEENVIYTKSISQSILGK